MVFLTSRRGRVVDCKAALVGAIGPTSVGSLVFSLAVTLLGDMIILFAGSRQLFDCSVIHICGEVSPPHHKCGSHYNQAPASHQQTK